MAPAMRAPRVIGVPAVAVGKGKSGQPRTSTPPPRIKLAATVAGQGTSAAPQKAALGSPLRDPRSPGTVPMAVYREACRDRDQFRHERDAACLAGEASTCPGEQQDTVKQQRDNLQAKLVDAARPGAAAQARLEVFSGPRA